MAAPSPPRFFAVWRVEPFVLCVILCGGVFKLRWTCAVACPCTAKCFVLEKSLKHSAVVHTTPCAFYVHTVIWLGRCQFILTQTEHSSELGMVSYWISTFGSMTCSQVGLMSLGCPMTPSGGLVQSSLSLSQEHANGKRPGSAHLAPPPLRWGDVTLLNHQKRSETGLPEIHVSVFSMVLFCVLRGTRQDFLGKEARQSYIHYLSIQGHHVSSWWILAG